MFCTNRTAMESLKKRQFAPTNRMFAIFKALACVLVLSVPLTSNASATVEEQVTTLLNCAVIIASTEGGMNSYEDYVIAASYLAADNGLSSEWLSEKIQLASETAYEFAGQTRAAERCVATLRSAEELLQ